MACQGSGRFCGSCLMMSALGIAEKTVSRSCRDGKLRRGLTSGNAEGQTVAESEGQTFAESLGAEVEAELVGLGNTSTFKLLDDDSVKLEQFVRDALGCEMEWQKAHGSRQIICMSKLLA